MGLGDVASNTSGVLQLGDTAAVNTTVASLTTAGTGTSNAVVGGFTSNSTLTVNNASDTTFGGMLGGSQTNQNNLALAKSGAGALVLNGANTFTGGTTVSAGKVLVGNSIALGSGAVTMSAASSVQTNGPVTIANNITGSVSGTSIGGNSASASTFNGTITTNTGGFNVSQVSGGTLTLSGTLTNTNNNRAFNFVNVGDLLVSGSIGSVNAGNPTFSVSQQGSGTTTLSNANTYGGGTKIQAGKLLVTNTSGSATGTGGITVSSGATFGGNGSVSGAVTATTGAMVQVGLTDATSGATASTFTIGGGSTVAGTLLEDITAINAADKLVINGAATFGGTLNVSDPNTVAYAAGQSYELLAFTGTPTGTFATVTLPTLASGLQWDTSNLYSTGVISIDTVVAGPTASQWALSTGGTWGSAGSWQTNGTTPGTIPTNAGDTATFASAPGLTSSDTVTLDGNHTVGHVVFNNASASYTIAQGSGGTLTIDNSGTGSTGAPSITVTAGSHTIAAPLAFAASNTVTRDGSGTLTLAGAMSVTASGTATLAAVAGMTNISTDPTSAISLHASNNGTLVNFTPASSGGIQIRHDGLTIDSGAKVALQTLGASNHPNRTLLITDSLSIGGSAGAWTGTLDVGGNDAIIHNGNVTNLTSQLRSGFVGGGTGATLWTGTGVNSAVANADTRGIVAVGMRSQSASFASFDGQTLSAGDVALKETFFGDADLSGSVNATDYSLIDVGYGSHLTGWENGDFNYDGVVNATDYSLIDQSYVFQSTGAPSLPTAPLAAALWATADGGGSASVPEPASLSLLALACGRLLARRRRK
jgi:autotransporter-associated beta strand protein